MTLFCRTRNCGEWPPRLHECIEPLRIPIDFAGNPLPFIPGRYLHRPWSWYWATAWNRWRGRLAWMAPVAISLASLMVAIWR